MKPSEWEARRGLVTASRIAKIAGVSRFGGPCSAFLEMTADKMDEAETEAQKRGRILEPSILRWYQEQVPGWTVDPGVLIRDPRTPWAAASPDALAFLSPELQRVVEAKSSARAEEWGEEQTDQIPAEYLCQTQFQMGVTGIPRADVPVLLSDQFAGFRFALYVVLFDEALFGHLAELGAKFHRDHIQTGKPPPPDSPEQGEELLARFFPRAVQDEPIAATEEIDSLGLQLCAARKEKEAAEAKELVLKNAIKEWLGDRKTVLGTGWKGVWSNVKGKTVTNWEAIARELGAPDALIQAHTAITAGHRQFRPTFKDEIS